MIEVGSNGKAPVQEGSVEMTKGVMHEAVKNGTGGGGEEASAADHTDGCAIWLSRPNFSCCANHTQ
jgi:hypothetical protein